MIVTTESGTEYEFTPDHTRVRRLGGDTLRRDGDWLGVTLASPITLDQPIVMFLEPLGEGNVTIRTTSRVVGVNG